MNNGNSIYCLMAAGPGLDDDIRNALFDAAQNMMRSERMRWPIKNDSGEGVVTTEGKFASMGYISGIVFHAEIETDAGKITTNYIVRAADFRASDGLWTTPEAIESFLHELENPVLN